MCLHVTHDMLMLLLIFSVLTLLTVSHYGRWIWIQSSFPQNTCHHQNHISHHFYASNIVLYFVRSIFSVYTNMVMKIFTAELSSIIISITFPSLHNFLFSLELLVFLCLFNLPCFLCTYHWFIPKILSHLSKISLNSSKISGISAIYSSGKHVSGGCCHLDWLLSMVVQLWFWNLPSPICEILITSLANC